MDGQPGFFAVLPRGDADIRLENILEIVTAAKTAQHVMSFSYSACETLAEIARLQNRGADAARWSLQAARVRDKLVDYLWDDARGACFDRDKNHRPQSVLTHNTLRCMYWNSLPAPLAARFVKEHLCNPAEFWTPMDDLFGMQYRISVENQPYPVLCTLSADGCTTHVPDFPKITTQAATLDVALLEVKQQIQKALRQYKNPPIPTKQEQIVVPQNSVLVLVKASRLH